MKKYTGEGRPFISAFFPSKRTRLMTPISFSTLLFVSSLNTGFDSKIWVIRIFVWWSIFATYYSSQMHVIWSITRYYVFSHKFEFVLLCCFVSFARMHITCYLSWWWNVYSVHGYAETEQQLASIFVFNNYTYAFGTQRVNKNFPNLLSSNPAVYILLGRATSWIFNYGYSPPKLFIIRNVNA